MPHFGTSETNYHAIMNNLILISFMFQPFDPSAVRICRVVDEVVTDDCQVPHIISRDDKYVLRLRKVVAEHAGVYV